MPTLKMQRLRFGLLAGEVTAAQLTSILATPTALGQWFDFVRNRRLFDALPESSLAMTAIAGSGSAMNIIAGSSAAKLAIWESDVALRAIGAAASVASRPGPDALFNHASALTVSVATNGATTPLTLTGLTAGKMYLALATNTSSTTTGSAHGVASIRLSGIPASLTTDSTNVNKTALAVPADGKYFTGTAGIPGGPVPIMSPFTAQTNNAVAQTLRVRLINCSDDSVSG